MTGLQTSLGKADAPPAIIPQPAELDATPGEFRITESTTIWVAAGDAEVRACGTFLAECLRQQTGYELPVQEAAAGKLAESASGGLRFIATRSGNASDEEYHLLVTPNAVTLTANQPRGVFLGIQTIRQLLRPAPAAGEAAGIRKNINWRLPCVRISDRPRYRWRGMLLDCGRHFMTKDFVKRYIDLLAYHKMNVLHWHLTEDQGWRIEIRKYPKLTEIGAWRGTGGERYGGFYTQDDIREIVAYAQSRYVTIVPEIEMPGHAQAALASYPKLSCTGGPFEVGTKWGVYEEVYCAGNEQTFAFLEDVLSEVLELFPSEFIHIGGDECPKTRWQACPKCQARIKAEGLKDEHELQSYFIRRIEKFLNSKGRRLIGWDEILEGGLAPNATVQSWRGLAGAIAAAESGHDVVSSPTSHCYLDYAQARRPGEPTWMGYIDLATTYSFEPTPAQLTPAQARHVLGLEGNIWTEHAPQERVDWQVFPRLCALAEVAWSPKEARNWAGFSSRLAVHYHRLDALGVTYYLPAPECPVSERKFTESIMVSLENPFGRGNIRYTVDGSEPTPDSLKYTAPFRLADSTTIAARLFLDTGRASDVAVFRFQKVQPPEIAPQ